MFVQFDIPDTHIMRRETALALTLLGPVAINRILIRKFDLPPLYDSGVRYRKDRRRNGKRNELLANAYDLVRRGYGDCDDLAAYRAAELQLAGIDAKVCVVRTGPRTLHAVVCNTSGEIIDDPSRRLGMKGKRR